MKRKVLFFNVPFSKLSDIDIGKYFLKSIDRHFHLENPLNNFFK